MKNEVVLVVLILYSLKAVLVGDRDIYLLASDGSKERCWHGSIRVVAFLILLKCLVL